MTQAQTDLLDWMDSAAAAKARDAGLTIAAENAGDFITRALAVIASMHGEVQGETIRAECISRGVEPKSHKAWGALVQSAIKRGLLNPTGRFEKTKSVKTHCHPTQVYRVAA